MKPERTFINAYKWNLIGKWGLRFIGIFSTLILVRLLSPEDFGIVAIGLMVVGFFEVISSAGVTRYLILKESVSESEYNAAWTLNVFLKLFSVTLIVLLAGPIADFLESPKVQNVVIALSCLQILKAFKNVELIRKEKEMDFSYINKIQIYAKIAAVLVTIPTAFYFKSYIALIIGTLINSVTECALSYILCPRRPKFNFNIERQMVSFSSFILIRNLLSYTRSQIDIFIIGDKYGSGATGKFKVARDFVLMPKTEIIDPASQPLFVGVARMEEEKLSGYSQRLLFYFVSVLTPFSFFFYFNSMEFVSVVFGQGWLDAERIVSLVGFLTIPLSLQSLFLMLIDKRGYLKQSFSFDIIAIIYLFAFIALFSPVSINEFVEGRIAVAFLSFITITLITVYLLKLQLLPLATVIAIPTAVIYLLALISNEITSLISVTAFLSMAIYFIVFCSLFLITGIAFLFIAKRFPSNDTLHSLHNEITDVLEKLLKATKDRLKHTH